MSARRAHPGDGSQMNLSESDVRFWNPYDGFPLNGYAAWSTLLPHSPAIVLIPDVSGIQDVHREVARRFAREGFLALAVNPYSRTGAPTLPDTESAKAWLREFADKRMLADVTAAVTFVLGHERVRASAVAIAGFGMGGQYALMAACTDSRLRACVTWSALLRHEEYTPSKPNDPLDLSPDLRCPYLGMFGADDEMVPTMDVEELRALLKHFRKSFEIKHYPEAGHDFFLNPRSNSYGADAVGDSWPRALAFLHRHLGL